MCPSTPIAGDADVKPATKCSSGSCMNNNNNNNNNNKTSTLNSAQHSEAHDESSNSVSIRNRICYNQKEIQDNKNVPSNAMSEDEKHEHLNAVYKEIPLTDELTKAIQTNTPTDTEYNPQIRWLDFIAQIYLHAGFLYGFYLLFQAKFYTILWVVVTVLSSCIGITAGAHRLWSHKSYTASTPLKILLGFLFTISGQRDIYTWVLDHRIHHKFSETDADPHNAQRGFFFSHIGWLFLTPHPKVVEKRKVIDMSDLQVNSTVVTTFILPANKLSGNFYTLLVF